MQLNCQTDARRDAVRAKPGRSGLDYVEVDDDGLTLYAYFLGRLPPPLREDGPDLPRLLRIDGGERIRGIRILDADPLPSDDAERDDCLRLTLDRQGDFSTYHLVLQGLDDVDPRYGRAPFRFRQCCPTLLDCKPDCGCAPPAPDEPVLDYLARDYAALRQLIYDRLALRVPGWSERHVPDLGVTLVELLAYAGDYLSYYQDAVATEAYLDTARQRISVRRHARLVDYFLHEGCNARAWVQVQVSQDVTDLRAGEIGFITALNHAFDRLPGLIDAVTLERLPRADYEYFEALAPPAQVLPLYAAHNEIAFYTWGGRECCLERGATRATLVDGWAGPGGARKLRLQPGDVLILEEVAGAQTGVPEHADPSRRWAVRLRAVRPLSDDVLAGAGETPAPEQGGKPEKHSPGEKCAAAGDTDTRGQPLLEVEWDAADALPFSLCLSALRRVAPVDGGVPDCAYLARISVARGNVLLVDHGRSRDEELPEAVPVRQSGACCDCVDSPGEVTQSAGLYRPRLAEVPLTWQAPAPSVLMPAALCLRQDPRSAAAALQLRDSEGRQWLPRPDLLASAADDSHVVVEINNDGLACLRFGDGELGRAPTAGSRFSARYRLGNGVAGNVGAEAIACLVLHGRRIDGLVVSVRNPLPASGGSEPESMAAAKLLAPAAFRQRLERAITADDYARIAQRDARLQRAAARLVWTGSWYEADVALDPLGGAQASPGLLRELERQLRRYRRMGHDLHARAACYVPLLLRLQICVLPGHARAQVLAAVLRRLGSGTYQNGKRGYFHPDELSFGQPVHASRIAAAAQAVPGVECATVLELRRFGEPAAGELDAGLLTLAAHEIARLDNDPNHPERGRLLVEIGGGR
ncbi:putative baseplate assembly protein [Tahibacter harae]|uniref:Baseplate assembly protein n=1 Tax=Tahibacter harae TaxID=2963937 RepID=A0ABT1QRL2_9GAMM|nr:putative baseplate assembly protein [Tahibacter harae]MCQ4164901.1 putative baseplate assembly protein [Tahibacter harae]